VPEARRDDAGEHIGQRRYRGDHRIVVVRIAEHRAQHEGTARAERRDHGAAGRGERVGSDEFFVGHDPRQRRAQRREHEPADREDDQRRGVEGEPAQADRDLGGDAEHRHRPDQVREAQHPLAPPPVQQHAGKRSDHRVGQQQHREPAGDVGGVRLPFRVEQHRAGQAGLEHPVAELGREPHREQTLETTAAERAPQVMAVACAGVCSAGGHLSRRLLVVAATHFGPRC
jgi:hypothetical protein